MERLTRDNDTQYDLIGNYNSNIEEFTNNHKLRNSVLNKLGQLEDIEEELECDLITLFKALKQGYIYVKLEDGIIKREVDMLDFKEGVRCVLFYKSCQVDNNLQCYDMLNYIQDYGKSWALTREELEENKQ